MRYGVVKKKLEAWGNLGRKKEKTNVQRTEDFGVLLRGKKDRHESQKRNIFIPPRQKNISKTVYGKLGNIRWVGRRLDDVKKTSTPLWKQVVVAMTNSRTFNLTTSYRPGRGMDITQWGWYYVPHINLLVS